MKNSPLIIKGASHKDGRGIINFVNDFDMQEVKRFYTIEHPNKEIIRAWRAHRIEQRWFHVIAGAFRIRLVKIDNWESPSKTLAISEFVLSTENIEVLHVPVGYGSWIEALNVNSRLMVFSDYGIENAKVDDYLYPADYFETKQ